MSNLGSNFDPNLHHFINVCRSPVIRIGWVLSLILAKIRIVVYPSVEILWS